MPLLRQNLGDQHWMCIPTTTFAILVLQSCNQTLTGWREPPRRSARKISARTILGAIWTSLVVVPAPVFSRGVAVVGSRALLPYSPAASSQTTPHGFTAVTSRKKARRKYVALCTRDEVLLQAVAKEPARPGYKLVEAVLDSGAEESVSLPKFFPGLVVPSTMSKAGGSYRVANGQRVPNIG